LYKEEIPSTFRGKRSHKPANTFKKGDLLKVSFSALVCVLSFAVAIQSQAKAKHGNPPPHVERELAKQQDALANPGNGQDTEIVDAVNNKRRVNFVEGSGMLVVKVLPDDTNGLQHQKWVVQLSNGKYLQAVYNSDMCPRVPIKVGDVVDMGGQFIWTQQGGLLHWLHHDPRGSRPDGYVKLDGTTYCGN
jgi:hypothetical protein